MKPHKGNTSPSALSVLLVGIQFVLIAFIMFTGPLWPQDWWLRGILASGGMIGLWALYIMGLRQVKVFPEVPSEGTLIVSGPYRWIRHPMYTGVLLVTLAWSMANPLPYRIFLWVGLLITLIVKLLYEEGFLLERFPEYKAYQRQTSRLIPFVW